MVDPEGKRPNTVRRGFVAQMVVQTRELLLCLGSNLVKGEDFRQLGRFYSTLVFHRLFFGILTPFLLGSWSF